MAESPAHRLDLCIGGKYRLSKMTGSGSFGMCCSYLTRLHSLTPLTFLHYNHGRKSCSQTRSPRRRQLWLWFFWYVLFLSHTVCARSPPSHSCTTTMAKSPAHRLDLRVGGKYRLSKISGSGSFCMCCSYLTVCVQDLWLRFFWYVRFLSHTVCARSLPSFLHYNHGRKSRSQT